MARPIALITGASSGIGAALAREVAKDGYDVVLSARRVEPMQALAGELESYGASATILATNLSKSGNAQDRRMATWHRRFSYLHPYSGEPESQGGRSAPRRPRALGKGGDKVGLKVVYKKHAVLFGRSNVHDPNIERSSSRSFLTELVHERFLDGEPNGQAIRADLDLFLKATCELGGSHRFSPVDDQMRPPSRNSANLSGVDGLDEKLVLLGCAYVSVNRLVRPDARLRPGFGERNRFVVRPVGVKSAAYHEEAR
jgi:hypothetical protein